VKPSLGSLLARGLTRRCPRCGEKKVWRSWSQLVDDCPRCGWHFEREEGYWVSAIIVNTGVTMAVFGILFVGVLIATIPDVQWGPVLLVAAVTNVIFPILFFPSSKTVWVAIDLFFHSPKEWQDV
jgi:uncharacterized protein (DUF983 family)